MGDISVAIWALVTLAILSAVWRMVTNQYLVV